VIFTCRGFGSELEAVDKKSLDQIKASHRKGAEDAKKDSEE
jgi:hypothetical protein